jgi:uncharacterized membrane protein
MRLPVVFSGMTLILAGTASAADPTLRLFEEPPVTSGNGVLAALLVTLALIYWLTGSKAYQRLPIIRVVPAVFLVYFVPMVLNTVGLFDSGSSKVVYGYLRDLALPMSLVLVLIGADLPLIARLGPKAIAVMLVASVGVLVGGVLAFISTKGFINDPDLWRGVGALSGSWIGGSANMIAAKEALQCPQRVFTPMTVVDIVCGYGWMIVVMALAGIQVGYDRWNRANTEIIEEINHRMGAIQAERARPIRTPAVLFMLAIAAIAAHLSMIAGRWFDSGFIHMPPIERLERLEAFTVPQDWPVFERHLAELAGDQDTSGLSAPTPRERVMTLQRIDEATDNSATIALRQTLQDRGVDPSQVELPLYRLGSVVNGYAIMIILVSIVGLLLSLTKLRGLEDSGAGQVGYALLFVTLAAIGAQADLNEIFRAPEYLILGAVWIALFAVTLFLISKVFRAPLFLVATASQANIGGTVSAPIVAGAYQPNLAVVGVLMAVIGQMVGTFMALLTGWICSLFA